MTNILMFIFWFLSANAEGTKSICSIRLVHQPMSLEDPVETTMTVTLDSPKDGFTGQRHRFELQKTDFECELAFSGFDRGTFINCWKKDLTVGMQSDRSVEKAPNESARPNYLRITGAFGGFSITAKCPKK